MSNRYTLPILSGLLIGTSYIPFPPWALFFCLAPVWIFALGETVVKRAFWGGWITQFILNLIGFHWIAYTAVEFGHFPWPVGVLVLLGFCAIAHLYLPVSLALWVLINNRLKLKTGHGVFLLATLFAFFELVFPTLFPWHLGYPWLWAGFPGAQTADLWGFQGLNTLTLATNALVALAWLNRRKRAWLIPAGVAAGMLILVNVLGLFRVESWRARPEDPRIKVLVVQGNIGNAEKIMAEKGRGFQDEIVSRYVSQSRSGLERFPNADILMWPETAFPDYLNERYRFDPSSLAVHDFLRKSGKPLLTGAYSRDPEKQKTYNGLFLVDNQGGLPVQPYHKTILLAFGEYFPGVDYMPWIMKLMPEGMAAFGRGSGPTVMSWNGWKLGAQICYEGLYPWFTRQLSEQGAELIVNVTNDSWFGTLFEPRQHLYMTLARAIEFRRPLIRATNTGITTAILASGEILQKSPLHEEWQGLFAVPFRRDPPHTVYEKVEPWWPILLVAAAIGLCVAGRRKAW